MCQSLVRASLITRFKFVDPDRRVLTRLECRLKEPLWLSEIYCEIFSLKLQIIYKGLIFNFVVSVKIKHESNIVVFPN